MRGVTLFFPLAITLFIALPVTFAETFAVPVFMILGRRRLCGRACSRLGLQYITVSCWTPA